MEQRTVSRLCLVLFGDNNDDFDHQEECSHVTSPQIPNKFKKILIKKVDKYSFPHLLNLISKDAALRVRIFGSTSEPLDEHSWFTYCLASDDESISEWMEIRMKMLEALFNFLSTQTRICDPNYKKFVCLSDPSKIFHMLTLYHTKEEAKKAAEVTIYFPPVSVIGQLGIDFISHSSSRFH
jgi:hypothetical protein